MTGQEFLELVKASTSFIEIIAAFGAVYIFLRRAAKKDIAQLEKRFDLIDNRFVKIDDRFVKIDDRFVKIDDRFTKLEESLKQLEYNLRNEIRQTRIEFKIDELKRTGTEDKKC
jgi:hypothetical protein